MKENEKINEELESFYWQMGYSNHGRNIEDMMLYHYGEPAEDLMEYNDENGNIAKSEFATKFNLKHSDINIIIKSIKESAAHQRTSHKSMMATRSNTMIPPVNNEELKKLFKDSESLIQTRQTHMEEVAEIARIISEGIGANTDFAYLIGLIHDIGHTWNGHSGERILSALARYNNCGFIVHNAMGAYIMEREEIINNAIEEVKQFNPKVDEAEVRRFMKYVIDGVVSHNGEGTVGQIIPNKDKTLEQMAEEIRKCFTVKSYDKKIMPATIEGAIIRYADIIAYTRSDILDGFRLKDVNGKKILEEFDDDYLEIIGTLLARKNNNTMMLDLENKFLLELYGLSKRIDKLSSSKNPDDIRELKCTKKEREIIERQYKEFVKLKVEYARRYIDGIEPKNQIKTKVTRNDAKCIYNGLD